MSIYTISNSQLNSLCIHLKNNTKYYYTYVNHYFELMYLTGCRASESIDPKLWSILSDTHIKLSPLKYNNDRIFLKNDIECFLIDNLIAGNLNVFDLNYSKINYHILQQLRSYKITIGDKSSSLHLFRHNYARQLKVKGFTDAEIKIKLGERNQSSANGYIYSEIFSAKPLLF